MSRALTVLVLGAAACGLASAKVVAVSAPRGVTCDACKDVVQHLDSWIEGEATTIENDISNGLCPLLPTNEQTECKAFVDKYGQELVQYIAKELDPTATCEAVHVCQLDTALTAVKKNPVLRVGNSTECTICTDLISSIDEVLSNPQDQATIINFILSTSNVCAVFGPLSSVCKDLITTYGDDLLTFLSQKITSQGLCVDTLHLC